MEQYTFRTTPHKNQHPTQGLKNNSNVALIVGLTEIDLKGSKTKSSVISEKLCSGK